MFFFERPNTSFTLDETNQFRNSRDGRKSRIKNRLSFGGIGGVNGAGHQRSSSDNNFGIFLNELSTNQHSHTISDDESDESDESDYGKTKSIKKNGKRNNLSAEKNKKNWNIGIFGLKKSDSGLDKRDVRKTTFIKKKFSVIPNVANINSNGRSRTGSMDFSPNSVRPPKRGLTELFEKFSSWLKNIRVRKTTTKVEENVSGDNSLVGSLEEDEILDRPLDMVGSLDNLGTELIDFDEKKSSSIIKKE